MKYILLLEEDANDASANKFNFSSNDFIRVLDESKGILLQADDIDKTPLTVEDFGSFVKGLNLTPYPYVGGAAPRRVIPVAAGEDIVYTANEAPPAAAIPFHHELAQNANPPAYIFFFCDEPAAEGGETALIDSTLVYRFVQEKHPAFMEKLKTHGARYVRTLSKQDDPSSPIGRSYFNTYAVETKADLETKLDAISGLEYEWLPGTDDEIRVTSEPVPAIKLIREHKGQAVYQYTFHNAVIAAFTGWQDDRNDRLKAVRFGNDEEMPNDVLESIAGYMEANKVSYRWKKGDVFCLNNRLVMHSRNPFTHPLGSTRKVYASMWGESLEALPVGGAKVAETNVSLGAPAAPYCHQADCLTFGFWRLENPEEVAYQAIKAGYRRLDSACDYGNEKETGRGIARAIKEGICTRADLHITSKLWNTYHDPAHVRMACERTLRDMQLDYLDEYLIHFPISLQYVPFEAKYPPEWTNLEGKMVLVNNDINTTWAAMEELVDAGLTKCIGLSNFNCQHIRQVLSVCRVRPTTLQVEVHPHNSQVKLLRFAREAGLRVACFSPLGATSYISLDMATESDVLMRNKIVEGLAKKHNKTSVQVMLRWALQRNTLPISKSNSPVRMRENRDLFDFYLHKRDMEALDALNQNRRFNDPGVFAQGMGTFCPIYE